MDCEDRLNDTCTKEFIISSTRVNISITVIFTTMERELGAVYMLVFKLLFNFPS